MGLQILNFRARPECVKLQTQQCGLARVCVSVRALYCTEQHESVLCWQLHIHECNQGLADGRQRSTRPKVWTLHFLAACLQRSAKFAIRKPACLTLSAHAVNKGPLFPLTFAVCGMPRSSGIRMDWGHSYLGVRSTSTDLERYVPPFVITLGTIAQARFSLTWPAGVLGWRLASRQFT